MTENLKNRVKNFLSAKSISILIILLAIGSRILQLLFFFNIRVDGMYQYLAMKYFVNGHGVSLAEVLLTDLSNPVYEPLINWPPGYSILLSPFYILFNHNYVAAGLTVDVLAAVALIVFARKILRLLELPVYLINIYTLFTGFFIYNFYFIASSDAIAISLYIIALYYCLLLIKSNSRWLLRTVFISVLLIACGFIKYLFYPVVFVIPVFLIAKGILDKNFILKKAGFFSLTIISVCLISLLMYQKNISGAAAYISQPERGFFLENLKLAYPFITASIINPETVTRVLSSLRGVESSIFRLFQLVHVLSLIGIVVCVVKWLRKNSFRKLNLINSFYSLTIIITLSITGLLLILSLSVAKEEINPGVLWSYIEDARYHGLITVLFQMSLFILIHQISIAVNTKWKFIPILIILLLITETFRGIIFDANRIIKIKTEEYSWQSELKLQQFADKIISNKKKTENFKHTVVAGTSYYMNYRVCIYNEAYYLNNYSIANNDDALKSTNKILLLLILETSKTQTQQEFFEKGKFNFEGEFKGFNFYTKMINPK